MMPSAKNHCLTPFSHFPRKSQKLASKRVAMIVAPIERFRMFRASVFAVTLFLFSIGVSLAVDPCSISPGAYAGVAHKEVEKDGKFLELDSESLSVEILPDGKLFMIHATDGTPVIMDWNGKQWQWDEPGDLHMELTPMVKGPLLVISYVGFEKGKETFAAIFFLARADGPKVNAK